MGVNLKKPANQIENGGTKHMVKKIFILFFVLAFVGGIYKGDMLLSIVAAIATWLAVTNGRN